MYICIRSYLAMLFRRFFISLILFSQFAGRAQSSVTVTLSNVRNANGSCNVAMYTSQSAFLNPKMAYRSKVVKAQKGAVKVTFEDVPAGNYAIAVIHDENNDANLNTNMIGIPKEGYGASNNNLPWTSAPSFSKAVFQLGNGSREMVINLRYY